MMMANDGPLTSAFNDTNTEGIIRKELTTYRMVNGRLQKEIVVRDDFGNGKDYHDSIQHIPLRTGIKE